MNVDLNQPVRLSVAKLKELADPTATSPWTIQSNKALRKKVMLCLEDECYSTEPVGEKANAYTHASRIAYFVKHGFGDPIEVDFGIPSMCFRPGWPIDDGNHRYYAAILRGDDYIMAKVSGEADYIEEFLYEG